jgi:hypothetical protein
MSVAHPSRPYRDCSPSQRTPVAPQHVEIVTFAAPASTTTTPRSSAVAWPRLAHRLTRHEQRTDKDGPGWSPAIYRRSESGRPLTRAKASIEAVTCAVADVDHAGLDDIGELVEHVRGLGLAAAMYSTHSHSSVEPRVRLVIPFADPVPAELWPRLWPSLNATIFLGLADRAASDASRMYYLPSTPGGETLMADSWEGAALDWRTLPLADVGADVLELVTTTGAGPSSTVPPEDMPILERLFSGRRGEQRMRAWMGDYADFGGNASAADQSIANGLVAYCRGDTARAERIMRAGAWRPKWEEPRRETTWLGATLSKALGAYRAWIATGAAPDDAPEPDGPPIAEMIEEKLARLERQLAAERADKAVLQTVLRAERAEKLAAVETVRAIGDLLALPKEHLSPPAKVMTIATLLEVHSRASRGVARLGSRTLEQRTGMTANMVSACIGDLAARDNSPIERRLTREWVPDEHGQIQPITVAEVIPRHATVRESLAAVLTMGGPSDREQKRRASDRERTERNAAWGHCSSHDNQLVDVKGSCPVCGEVVGELLLAVQEFEALNPGIRETGDDHDGDDVDVRINVPGIRETGAVLADLPPFEDEPWPEPPGLAVGPGRVHWPDDDPWPEPPLAPREHIAGGFLTLLPPGDGGAP